MIPGDITLYIKAAKFFKKINNEYQSLFIMQGTALLITLMVTTYSKSSAFFIAPLNLIIIYLIFRHCLLNIITTKREIQLKEGWKESFLNPFRLRTCGDGILCSTLVFLLYLFFYILLSIQGQVNKYGANSPQGFLILLSTSSMLLFIFFIYKGLKLFQ